MASAGRNPTNQQQPQSSVIPRSRAPRVPQTSSDDQAALDRMNAPGTTGSSGTSSPATQTTTAQPGSGTVNHTGESATPVTPKPAGIVSSAAAPKATEVGSIDPSAPVTRQVDPATETVGGQMGKLLGKNSPYLKLARDNAMRQANSRGLINSTMAAQAGEEAAIAAALPIAQGDAKVHAEQAQTNQANENRFAENQQSASLNAKIAEINTHLDMHKDQFNTELKKDIELTLADTKLSNDMKTTYATELSRIMAVSQEQIGTIGSSDRSPSQQEAAINQVIKQRDSQITLLKELMDNSVKWGWF